MNVYVNTAVRKEGLYPDADINIFLLSTRLVLMVRISHLCTTVMMKRQVDVRIVDLAYIII